MENVKKFALAAAGVAAGVVLGYVVIVGLTKQFSNMKIAA